MLYRVIGTVIGTLIEVRVLIPRYNKKSPDPPRTSFPLPGGNMFRASEEYLDLGVLCLFLVTYLMVRIC